MVSLEPNKIRLAIDLNVASLWTWSDNWLNRIILNEDRCYSWIICHNSESFTYLEHNFFDCQSKKSYKKFLENQNGKFRRLF
jgi:hypothetical protein